MPAEPRSRNSHQWEWGYCWRKIGSECIKIYSLCLPAAKISWYITSNICRVVQHRWLMGLVIPLYLSWSMLLCYCFGNIRCISTRLYTLNSQNNNITLPGTQDDISSLLFCTTIWITDMINQPILAAGHMLLYMRLKPLQMAGTVVQNHASAALNSKGVYRSITILSAQWL